jgi:riboflavin biosynthesis pyrimidine reductase
VPAGVRALKQEDGPDLRVHGSANLIQTLLEHGLIDEFRVKIWSTSSPTRSCSAYELFAVLGGPVEQLAAGVVAVWPVGREDLVGLATEDEVEGL